MNDFHIENTKDLTIKTSNHFGNLSRRNFGMDCIREGGGASGIPKSTKTQDMYLDIAKRNSNSLTDIIYEY